MLQSRLFGILMVVLVSLIAFSPPQANAEVIRSWDDANQRGGDFDAAGTGTLEYSSLEAALEARGHTILPGVSTLSAATLAGVDVFFAGTGSHILTPAEAAAINAFVAAGGRVLVESNSASSEQATANSILSALGLGSPVGPGTGGPNSATGGTFANVVSETTVGETGDLRGLSFGTSVHAIMGVPAGCLAVGSTSGGTAMIECDPPGGPSGGDVLAVGDPYGFNLFQQSAESLFNANNQRAYINFIERQVAVPAPPTLALLGAGLLAGSLALLRRRRT